MHLGKEHIAQQHVSVRAHAATLLSEPLFTHRFIIADTPNLLTVTSGAGPRAVGTERGRWSE